MSVEIIREPAFVARCDRCGLTRYFVGDWPRVHTIPMLEADGTRYRANFSAKEATLCESCVAELIEWWANVPDDPTSDLDRGWWGGMVKQP